MKICCEPQAALTNTWSVLGFWRTVKPHRVTSGRKHTWGTSVEKLSQVRHLCSVRCQPEENATNCRKLTLTYLSLSLSLFKQAWTILDIHEVRSSRPPRLKSRIYKTCIDLLIVPTKKGHFRSRYAKKRRQFKKRERNLLWKSCCWCIHKFSTMKGL